LAIRAIFFDFDGVLADSMPYHLPAWNQVLEKDYGFSLDPMVIKLNEGRPVYEIAQAVFAAAGQPYTANILNAVITKKNALFRASHRATIFPENIEIIRRAKERGLSVGVVTGTKRENISYIIPDDLLVQFDVIIADGDAPRGKPSPDPYLLAAEKTAVAPKDCLVIENAPAGIQAAKAAGMFCVALKTTLPAEHLKQADVTFNNHAELLRAWVKFF
jgi:HAD superfamily hydrolase (TIGR01509 family)